MDPSFEIYLMKLNYWYIRSGGGKKTSCTQFKYKECDNKCDKYDNKYYECIKGITKKKEEYCIINDKKPITGKKTCKNNIIIKKN